ncbi:MAG: hypothetical protein ACYC91_02710 [Solirubrobacteraceae bacterium]
MLGQRGIEIRALADHARIALIDVVLDQVKDWIGVEQRAISLPG